MQDIKVTRTADFTGAKVTGLNVNGLGLMGKGRVFYVDNALGADGYGVQSQNPNYPMLTISAAMDICTAGVGDVIVVMQNSPSTGTTGEVWPIAMDVAGVMLTGLYSRGLLSDSGFGCPTLNTATITFGANYTNVENLYLGASSSGNSGGVIQFSGEAVYVCTVRNCMVEAQNNPSYGLYAFAANGTDLPYLLVEDNIFGSPHGAVFAASNIRLSNATRALIRRNIFFGATSYCLHLPSGCGNVGVSDNKFILAADTDGFAIYAASGCTQCWFDGNHAMQGSADTDNDPYKDMNGDDSNDWGVNYVGDDLEYPTSD